MQRFILQFFSHQPASIVRYKGASVTQVFADQDLVEQIHGIGILFYLICIENQIIGAILFIKGWLSGKKDRLTKIYFKCKQFHSFQSKLIYFFAKVLVLTGVYMNSWREFRILFIAYQLIIFALIIVLENIRSQDYKKVAQPSYRVNFKNRITSKPELQEIINMLNAQMPSSVIMAKFPHVKWLLEGNSVFDVTDFHHPGGNYLITKTLGRQMSQFFYGNYSLEEYNTAGFVHSKTAFQVLEELKFGEIDLPNANIIKLRDLQIQDPNHDIEEWQFDHQTKLNEKTYIFHFSSKVFHVKNWIQGTGWMARYFTLRFKGSPTKRIYTTIQCYSSLNIEYQNAIIHYFNKISQKENDFNPDLLPKQDLESTIDTIQFVIKIYETPSGLSQSLLENFIQLHTQSKDIIMEGPTGLGLQISPTQYGHYVIIAGGTGILPFLDFFFYLLKQAALRYFKMTNNEVYERFSQFDFLDERIFTSGFQVTLYAAWQDVDEYYGKDIIETLYKITHAMGLESFFNGFVRISGNNQGQDFDGMPRTDSYFTEWFFKEKLPKDVKQVMICGPPNMCYYAPLALKKNGIRDDQIKFI